MVSVRKLLSGNRALRPHFLRLCLKDDIDDNIVTNSGRLLQMMRQQQGMHGR